MAWWTWERVTAALVRRLPATVRNVGANGCLLETPVPLAPGTVGLLAIDHGESIEIETVRVCRTTEHVGGTMPFRAGVEFLVLDAGRPSSMRVRALERAAAHVAPCGAPRLAGSGENSGAGPTRTSVGAVASASDACAAGGMAMQAEDGSRLRGGVAVPLLPDELDAHRVQRNPDSRRLEECGRNLLPHGTFVVS